MADPVAVITITGTSEINYGDLTPTPPSRVLSGTTSTAGSGSSITDYQWYLLSSPTGSAATFNDDTLASPTLGPLDKAGTYRVFLVVTNDLSDTSHAAPVPTQSLSSPYAFTVPPASAFFEIRVLTEFAALKKVAYGERDWLEDGLWPIVDAVDAHEGKLDDIWVSAGVIKANTINEYTAGNGVTVDGVLLKDGDVKVATSSDAVYTNLLIGGSAGGGSSALVVSATPLQVLGSQSVGGTLAVNTISEFTTNNGVTIDGVLIKDNGITLGDGYAIDSTGGSASMMINGGADQIDFSAFNGVRFLSGTEVVTDWIEAISTDEPVTVRGNGAAASDLDVDVIRSDTNNSGVTVAGKGTHSYDLQASVIKTNQLTSDVVGAMTLSNTVGAVQITAATNITMSSGSSIQMAGLETNLGGSASYNSVPVCIVSQSPNTSTTGTTLETLWTINLPANMMHVNGDKILGFALFSTAANNHSKTVNVMFDGVTVATRTSSVNAGWIKVDFCVMRTGSSAQIYWSDSRDSAGVYTAGTLSTAAVTDTAAITFSVTATTATGAGDVTLKLVNAEFWHGDTLP